MRIIFTTIFALILNLTLSHTTEQFWPNHDISTLKLLQIVHRHGDRSPVSFSPNDPYKSDTYWPEGVGELTPKGKYRMYKRGQFIRQEYNSYLGDKYSPREVYVRSSITDRCIESVSLLLSGTYPPKEKTWQWNNGSDSDLGKIWQPFPIQTFMPKDEDLVCNQKKFCLVANNEKMKIFKRPVIKKFLDDNKEFYANLTRISGVRVEDLVSAYTLYDALSKETEQNLIWNKVWTPEQQRKVSHRLSESKELMFQYLWDSPVLKRLRAGGLVRELNNNFQSVLDNNNNKKIYVYSTHDTVMAALMHALNIYNGRSPSYGATLFFELHEKRNGSIINTNDYFVKVFYHNSTLINSGIPHSIPLTDCQNLVDCPLNKYFNSTKHLLYENFVEECNQKH